MSDTFRGKKGIRVQLVLRDSRLNPPKVLILISPTSQNH
ncbi:MAG: hypothetical protein ACJAWI_000895 [Marinomonas primoryensis]|jgi:hypothetical protein